MRIVNMASYALNFLLLIALSNAKTTINRYQKVMRMMGIK